MQHSNKAPSTESNTILSVILLAVMEEFSFEPLIVICIKLFASDTSICFNAGYQCTNAIKFHLRPEKQQCNKFVYLIAACTDVNARKVLIIANVARQHNMLCSKA